MRFVCPDACARPCASLPVHESLGFLFGCDDPSGKIHCASREDPRTFYRYPKGADD